MRRLSRRTDRSRCEVELRRFDAARRRIATFIVFGLLFGPLFGIVSGVFASERDDASILGNPMEKHFESPVHPIGGAPRGTLSKRPQYSDETIPTALRTSKSSSSENIRQVSTGNSDVVPFEWKPVPADTAPSATPSTVSGFPSLNGYGMSGSSTGVPSAPNRNGPDFGGMNGLSANPYFPTNTHFNTESPASASPQSGYNTILPQHYGLSGSNEGDLSAYGAMGAQWNYYDPSTGQAYPAPTNPYYSAPYGTQLSAWNPYDPNPYGSSGWNMMNSAGMPWNPYDMNGGYLSAQAIYQQELLRHQRSLDEEERKEEEQRRIEEEEWAASQWNLNRYSPTYVAVSAGKTLWSCAKTLSPFNTPTGPHRGVGMPLENRSWMDRPYYMGAFVGTMDGSTLVSGMIKQDDGANGGLILGYNMNEYWGLEGRFHFASLDIKETAQGRDAYALWYVSRNPSATYIPPLTSRTNQLTILDASIHYYPLGNAKFRPFFKYGLGLARESFRDTYGMKHNIDTMTMPIGIGLRYWWNERIAIQADLVDNIIFSRDIAKTQNNWTVSIGFTYSFGTSKKRRPSPRWPYTPSTGSKW